MTNFLIEPISIGGTLRCLTCHDGRATAGFLTDNYLTTPFSMADNTAGLAGSCSFWRVLDEDPGDEDTRGEITFATSCGISSVEITFLKGGGFYTAAVEIYLNGVLHTTQSLPDADEYVVTVSLTERPCGNLITLFGYGVDFPAGSEPAIVTAEITAVA